MNEANQTKGGEVDLLVLDYKMCFDSLYTNSVALDLYDSGIQGNHLNLIHEADKSHSIGVNTPCGITERVEVNDSVLQGECLGPLKCSNSVDKIGKQCIEDETNLYYYRNSTAVPPLGMVNDVICVAKCGAESVEMNAYVNAMSSIKKLQLGTKNVIKSMSEKIHQNVLISSLTAGSLRRKQMLLLQFLIKRILKMMQSFYKKVKRQNT